MAHSASVIWSRWHWTGHQLLYDGQPLGTRICRCSEVEAHAINVQGLFITPHSCYEKIHRNFADTMHRNTGEYWVCLVLSKWCNWSKLWEAGELARAKQLARGSPISNWILLNTSQRCEDPLKWQRSVNGWLLWFSKESWCRGFWCGVPPSGSLSTPWTLNVGRPEHHFVTREQQIPQVCPNMIHAIPSQWITFNQFLYTNFLGGVVSYVSSLNENR